MTAYRKCNICGNVWRTRETSRIPQCNQCRSKSSSAATEEDYIEYRKNDSTQSNAPTEDSTPQTEDEEEDAEPLTYELPEKDLPANRPKRVAIGGEE